MRRRPRFGRRTLWALRGIFGGASVYLYFFCIERLAVGPAVLLNACWPIFGSILSSIPIVVIALVSSGSFDLKQGLYVLGWIILIHLIEANFLNPKIMGDAAKIHPVLVVFALIAGEQSYGLVGALFAVPVASIIQTIFVYFRRRSFRPVPRPASLPR